MKNPIDLFCHKWKQGTIYRNAQLRYTHIMCCTLWEECKQIQCPPRSWRERTTALMWCYSPTKNKLIYQELERIQMIFGILVIMKNTVAIYFYSTPWALFPQKWCVAPEFFVLISSHCSTQIWRMRYGGSWSIYFLVFIICYYKIHIKPNNLTKMLE